MYTPLAIRQIAEDTSFTIFTASLARYDSVSLVLSKGVMGWTWPISTIEPDNVSIPTKVAEAVAEGVACTYQPVFDATTIIDCGSLDIVTFVSTSAIASPFTTPQVASATDSTTSTTAASMRTSGMSSIPTTISDDPANSRSTTDSVATTVYLSSSSIPAPLPEASNARSVGHDVSFSAIAGAVTGGFIFLIAAIAVLFIVIKRYRRRKRELVLASLRQSSEYMGPYLKPELPADNEHTSPAQHCTEITLALRKPPDEKFFEIRSPCSPFSELDIGVGEHEPHTDHRAPDFVIDGGIYELDATQQPKGRDPELWLNV